MYTVLYFFMRHSNIDEKKEDYLNEKKLVFFYVLFLTMFERGKMDPKVFQKDGHKHKEKYGVNPTSKGSP